MQSTLKRVGYNCCRFSGVLIEFNLREAQGWIIGNGIISLPDPDFNVGQKVPIMAWEDTATELRNLVGKHITVLTSFSENTFRGITKPEFTVDTFRVDHE